MAGSSGGCLRWEGKTDAFTAAGGEIIADVEARIAAVPEDERPSALILWKYSDGVPQVSGNGTFGTYWMKHLGVTDVAAEATGFTQVSMEQIYDWNPDILFVDGPGLIGLTSEDVLENRVEGTDFSSIKAVQDGRVYDTTLGMWNWFTTKPGRSAGIRMACMQHLPGSFRRLSSGGYHP